MYQLKFTLKQHTPLIHFQHDQEGATLRASEVKPKLDRYLINKYSLTRTITKNGADVEVPKPEFEYYFINNGRQHLALNYKLHISNDPIKTKYLVLSTKENITIQKQIFGHFPKLKILTEAPYFASNNLLKKSKVELPNGRTGREYNHTASKLMDAILAVTLNNIKCSILCIDFELKNCLEETLNEFFVFHNFGTRQNKGFGCFTISGVNGKPNDLGFEQIIKRANNQVAVFKTDIVENDINVLFRKISKSYQILKSGINVTTDSNAEYVKSLLFIYYCKEKKIRWEKRWIKQMATQHDRISLFKNAGKSVDCNCASSLETPMGANYNYVRAVLGISENFEFLKNSGSDKLQVSIKHVDIERYQSPILIKVNEGKVYFFGINTFDLIGSKDFHFKLNNKPERGTLSLLSDFNTLKTPVSFNVVEFLKWAGSYMHQVIDGEEPNKECEDDLINYAFKLELIKESNNV